MIEEDARAAVQLADDDALGAVDDERTGVGHQRDLAEVDLLLLDVADEALAAFALVVDHQLRGDLDRRGVGHAPLATLLDVVLRRFEVVAHEDQLAGAVEVLDREDGPEHALQAHVPAVVRRNPHLEELVVARLLNVDEVRHVDDAIDAAEVLADAKVRLDLLGHDCQF